MQKVKQKLAGLRAVTLSKAGRLTLIKSNLIGMPNYIMCYFKCPAKLHSELDKESRKFFWGNNTSLNPVVWNKDYTPSYRGIGE